MKSPPLLVASLLACIIVLGFNYWIASSRSLDLQSRIMELEGKVRRAAAERGAVELKKNEFQGELQKQREQIDKIQSLHSFQMENANRAHWKEKELLMNNITTNERLIQSLQEHLKELRTEYGRLQLDVYRFQKNQTNLQRKFSYDLSQCINQMKELKEQCEERINEISKKDIDVPQVKENKDLEDSKRDNQADGQLPAPKQPESKQTDLDQQRVNEDVPKAVPTVKRTDALQPNERVNGLTAIRKEDSKVEEEKLSDELKQPQDLAVAGTGRKAVPPESEKELNPSEDGKNIDEQKVPQPAVQEIADEEVEREQLLNYDAKQSDSPPGQADQQAQEALNQDKDVDYNLEENEAESETDKQAALAGIETVQNSQEKM
ncbi:Golgi membrane protein 1 isoform X1 [Gallus gallus]|uniref:Golgi membrane protein 1 isoform X1 n=1 Tax=Gallus gallus TaxID=9031 RepID=UPI001AE5B058|nr:Golgi membrane protein 1 isoform X1 [Gallus gallus]XP_040512397.1 Golgi membrane protein 1 isoform X1 [Gallus gallus]XP_040512398.1 Golgi membrane protein 1 isoform X1 [Gallus gallus]XP_040512400.1 Golgi membrane protein 1 isoform X1 [Gallus gallus]XP_046761907.1 Golgi membrane protein 1 isoform X1 [Gallus gallus]XP_046792770.1 Golgi membrane protein 1 isoform X1 [Gallus gallus]XP_046792771.1 Golgi membrane protein 1 isoform X1 [Gallus gallus]XP_046792772.1 Golgi membrane protein 1 isofor